MSVVVEGLAAWRLARMLTTEAGPYQVFAQLRHETGIEYQNGKAVSWPSWNPLHCTVCTGMYTAVLVYWLPRWLRTVLAVSAVGTVLAVGEQLARERLKGQG